MWFHLQNIDMYTSALFLSLFLLLSSILENFRSRFCFSVFRFRFVKPFTALPGSQWRAFVIRTFVCVDSSGIDNNPTVFYHLMPGSTAQTNKFHTFYLQQRPDQSSTWADIKVNHPLDYESIKEYNLTIRVEVWLVFRKLRHLRKFSRNKIL